MGTWPLFRRCAESAAVEFHFLVSKAFIMRTTPLHLSQRALCAASLAFFVLQAEAAPPSAEQMRAYGADMGRGQRCGMVVAEALLFSQLAKDLAQMGNNPDALNKAFLDAASAAREAAAPSDCKAATDRFDAALDELYKTTGRQR